MIDQRHRHQIDRRREPDEIGAAIAAAQAQWEASGDRMTEPRRRVFELLLLAGRPVKAYYLMDHYGAGPGAAKPPTIYRAIDFLSRKGLVHRIAATNEFVACDPADRFSTAAFLICHQCGSTAEISPPASDGLDRVAEGIGFTIEQTTIEISGRCHSCQ